MPSVWGFCVRLVLALGKNIVNREHMSVYFYVKKISFYLTYIHIFMHKVMFNKIFW